MTKAKPKNRPAAFPISHFADKSKSLLPVERLLEQPMIWWPQTGRLIAPWPKGPLTWEMENRLMAAIAQFDTLTTNEPMWIWPDRAPVPVKTEGDIANWLVRWGEGRASYVSHKRAA